MRVPAYIRFTLAELTAFGLQSASVLAKANSAIHLVLREDQVDLPSPEMKAACWIISVEDANGITMAVLKHRDGETWDRRVKTPIVVKSVEEGMAPLKGRRGYVVVDEHEPLVPRREPPHTAPAGEDRFQQGVDAMSIYLKRQFDIGGPIQKIEYVYGLHSKGADLVRIDGEFSLRYLAKAFLNAYQPEITISDQVRFKHAKRAMKLKLHHERVYGSIHFLSAFNDAIGEEQVDAWDDILELEGGIDIDALAKAFWSVMKGEGR